MAKILSREDEVDWLKEESAMLREMINRKRKIPHHHRGAKLVP